MEPVTAAGAFATIVGLLCNFRAESSGKELAEFLEWLEEKQHVDVARLLRGQDSLAQNIASLLSANQEELKQDLGKLDVLMSSIASQIERFSGLATSVHPEVIFSEQAISVLKQLVDSGAKFFIERKIMTGDPDEFILMDGGTGSIEYHEPQFIEDDLATLVSYGLLRCDFGSKGSRKFHLTRAASRMVSATER